MIGAIVHFRHPAPGCIAAVVTTDHPDGTADLHLFETYRQGRAIPSGTLTNVPRGRRDASNSWHPASGECE